MPYPHIFMPLSIGSLALPNRIIMGSMHTGLEETDKTGDRIAAFYEARARGGAALIVTGGVSPNLEGGTGMPGNEAGFGRLDSDAAIPIHQKVVEAVHQHDTKFLLQILHTGRYSFAPNLVAPSPIQAPISPHTPREMSNEDIERTIVDFVACAMRAKTAGYDGVEIMGSEGYLINQFLAERTNQRTDQWGGSFENRIRFALQIVEKTREKTGKDFLIMFRLSMIDLVKGGSDWPEVVALGKRLEAIGVDILNTGIGWHEARVPTIAQATPRGAWTWVTRAMKTEVNIPVVACNRINMPDQVEAVLAAGEADLVSMARPFLADAAFVNKARNDRADEINTCIACNQACLDHVFAMKTCSCLVNPRACHETVYPKSSTNSPKTIAVVGAGPAGMSFAAEAAESGHKVTLFENEGCLGGQLNIARNIPGKGEFDETIRYFTNRLNAAGVTLKPGQRADVAALSDGFDEVVLATGTTPRIPDIKGADHPKVVSYVEAITGCKPVGRRVAIVGAGGIGFDTAEFLLSTQEEKQTGLAQFQAKWGVDPKWASPDALENGGLAPHPKPPRPARQVFLLQRGEKFGRSLGKTTGWIHKAEMALGGVKMIGGVTYKSIDDEGLHIAVAGTKQTLEVDTVVICAGQVSNAHLEQPLRDAGIMVHVIGGADEAGELDAKRAILQGMKLAQALS
ncbi:MAG TPA: FAD-binding protein [Devosia sp.]|nr:FAD-binding protein [Devosia sp.]